MKRCRASFAVMTWVVSRGTEGPTETFVAAFILLEGGALDALSLGKSLTHAAAVTSPSPAKCRDGTAGVLIRPLTHTPRTV